MKYDKGEAARQRIIRCIRESIEANGVAPTYRDIADDLGMGLSTIVHHLKVLERAGIIERESGTHRALRLIG